MASPEEHPRLVHPEESREREVNQDARADRDESEDELAADCIPEAASQQMVDAPTRGAHEKSRDEALGESDRDRLQVHVAVFLPEQRVEGEERGEPRRGIRDRNAPLAETPHEGERESQVERDHRGAHLDGSQRILLRVEGAHLDLVGAVAPESRGIEKRDPRGPLRLERSEPLAVLEEEADDRAREDHEPDRGGHREKQDEAERPLENVPEILLGRREQREDDGGDRGPDERERELRELISIIEDRDGAV